MREEPCHTLLYIQRLLAARSVKLSKVAVSWRVGVDFFIKVTLPANVIKIVMVITCLLMFHW